MSKKSPIGVLIIDGLSIVGTSIASLLSTNKEAPAPATGNISTPPVRMRRPF
jgi:hypothetical protein